MKKIAALFVSVVLIHPQEALLPPALAAEAASVRAPAVERATLDGVEVGSDQVQLQLSGPVRYNTFVTANPPRLVLEVFNTTLQVSSKSTAGKGNFLKRVRSAQYAGEPNPITRVVMDLSEPIDYRMSMVGNRLRVRLGSLEAQTEPGPGMAEAEPAASAAVPAAKADSASPSPAKPRPPQPPAPSYAGSMSTQTSEDLSKMANEKAVTPRHVSDPEASGSASPVPAGRSLGVKRDILASLPRDMISLDLDSTEVGDILKLMAAKAGLNIIYGSDVSGPLSLHLTDVPFHEAFTIVLTMKGLVANQVGANILRVMTPAILTTERTNAIGVTRVFTLNYKKASEVKPEIDAIRTAEKRTTGSTFADDINNALVVTDTPDGLASIERLLSMIDIRPRQVLIETKLVEVSLNKDLALGIQWDYLGTYPSGSVGGQRAINQIGSISNANPITSFTSPTSNAPGQSLQSVGFSGQTVNSVGAGGRGTGVTLPADKIFGAFTFGRITNNYFLSATLTAAASEGKVKVLSDPKIATLNGKQATINITTQIPYVTSTVSSTGVATQAVSYTTTGIQLSVTPTITADGRIRLKVNPNVSKPSAVAASAGTTGAVAVDSRVADTNVLVRDGETIVIGGLITDSVSNTVAKIPLLGDIPILGWLFKKKTVTRSRVELLIFVTTKIMAD